MNRCVLLLCVLLGPLTSVKAEPSLDSHKDTYEAEVRKIDEKASSDLATLTLGYGRALDRILLAAQEKGELDTVLAAKNERQRLDKAQSAPKPSSNPLPDSILDARKRYHEARQKTEVAKWRQTADLTTKYVSALDRLIRSLTRDGKFDEAVVVKKEKQRAEFILADLESMAAKLPPGQAHPLPPVPSATRRAGETMTVDLGGGVKLEMAWIPPGSFMMGSPGNERDRQDNEGPQHKVTLTKGFWMGRYEVTQGQWQQVMGNNPSEKNIGPANPVDHVSWNQCRTFIEALNTQTKSGGFRLPTEAEWEYACRAGTTTAFHNGDRHSDLTTVAWYKQNSGSVTHPVGQKKPNKWGLYDMHGNLREFCADIYAAYKPQDVTDPVATHKGERRVIRGGSVEDESSACRSAYRAGALHYHKLYPCTFRIVRDDP